MGKLHEVCAQMLSKISSGSTETSEVFGDTSCVLTLHEV